MGDERPLWWGAFHHIWTWAVGKPEYTKKDWQQLEAEIQADLDARVAAALAMAGEHHQEWEGIRLICNCGWKADMNNPTRFKDQWRGHIQSLVPAAAEHNNLLVAGAYVDCATELEDLNNAALAGIAQALRKKTPANAQAALENDRQKAVREYLKRMKDEWLHGNETWAVLKFFDDHINALAGK
jgi:hypothetical protein